MRKVYLIRHGQSYSNIGVPSRYTETVLLTKTGEEEAQKLAEKLDKPDKIIVSKYIRTIKTAEPLINKHPTITVHLWNDIHEFDYIDREKYINTDNDNRSLCVGEYWKNLNPLHKDANDVESFKDFASRVYFAKNKMQSLENGTTYIFTHGHFMRMYKLLTSKGVDFNPNLLDEGGLRDLMLEFYELYTGHNELVIKNTEIFDITSDLNV